MCHIEQQHQLSKLFKVKELKNMYIKLLKCQGMCQSHVSRFAELLLERSTELEKRTVVKMQFCTVLFFNDAISEPWISLRTIQKVIIPLRKVMASSQNKFDSTFMEDCQVMSVLIKLLTLVNLLINGPNIDNSNFSQPSLTVS